MIKGRKTGYLAAVICMMLLCIIALAGCSNSKYQKIELPETKADSQNTEEESLEGQDHTVSAQGVAEARAMDGGGVPLVQSPNGDSQETAQASTSLLDKEMTTSNGFTDVDETVYVICDQVNVRTECAPGAEVLTQLNTGDPIKRTGYSESWSRVVYGDKVCYISSRFLSVEAPQQKAAGESGQEGAVKVQETQAPPSVPSNGRIVAIDAGHQAKGNSEKEPIGPGSATMKAKVASGATGIATGLKEYELNLMVSKKLKKILEDRGYQVYMIRETHDVNISNAERADMANNSGAAIFVRIHGNSLDNSSVHGALTMCQTSGNPYNGNLHSQSYSLSKKIVDSICGTTGAKNRGVQETDTMSGINWCTIPVSIVEMGFMSNPEEDRNLADDSYQDKVAQGIANGIDSYFSEN